jgi:hypothetical protein
MSEAERYTPEMWKQHVSHLVSVIHASDTKRNAFIDGFNGHAWEGIHHSAREAWERGRHTAILLGHISTDQSS